MIINAIFRNNIKMPIPSKTSDMSCVNLRSVTPPIDYPVDKGVTKTMQNKFEIMSTSSKLNDDGNVNQDQVVLYIDGRRLIRKKKRKCVKCKYIIIVIK